MGVNWNDYEGRQIANWRLESFLGARDERAFFVARSSSQLQPFLMQLMLAAGAQAAAVRDCWERAIELSHDHLLKIFDTGDVELNGVGVTYGIFDLPDDDLSEGLSARPLTEVDGKQMFSAIAGGLEYLHRLGLRHGAVLPSNVFLQGDKVKLGVDAIAPLAAGGRGADLKQFGSTLVTAMTGKADSSAAAQLNSPFREVVEGCWNGSDNGAWTAGRVIDVLAGRPEAAASIRVPPPPQPPPARHAAKRRWPIAAAVGIPAALLLGYWFIVRPAPDQIAAANPVVEAPQPLPPRVVEQKPDPTGRIPLPARAAERPPVERATTQRPVAERPAKALSRAVQRGSSSWAVIAATYLNYGAAGKRAQAIQRQSPGLRPRVYPEDGKGHVYYVVFGSGLTREAAAELLQTARASGAPRDSYVTKLEDVAPR